jgi:hypothetical protein
MFYVTNYNLYRLIEFFKRKKALCPLSREAEERAVERSNDRVSQPGGH